MQVAPRRPTDFDSVAQDRLSIDKVQAWEKVLFGMGLIHGGLIIPALAGLVLGTMLLAIIDFSQPDVGWHLGLIGFGAVYTLGLAVISTGLFYCCQAPSGFQGKSFAQAAFALTIVTGSLIAINMALNLAQPTWNGQLLRYFSSLPLLLQLVKWSGALLAVVCGLMFLRSIAQHFFESDLARHILRDMGWIGALLVGAWAFHWLAEFLRFEAPWLSFGVGPFLVLCTGILIIDLTRVVARLRAIIRRSLQ